MLLLHDDGLTRHNLPLIECTHATIIIPPTLTTDTLLDAVLNRLTRSTDNPLVVSITRARRPTYIDRSHTTSGMVSIG